MKFNILSYLAVAATLSRIAESKAVFAHYMLGAITDEHAQKDIDNAMAVGFDGFALNIGDSTLPWVSITLRSLFSHAQSRGFKLFVSMDVYAAGDSCYKGGNSCNGPFDYQWIWDAWKGDSAYYQVNGKPLITTFSSGGFHNDTWLKWKSDLANDMFFMPDFDETGGYYESAPEWWAYWGEIVDGIFSWETAWPERDGKGGKFPGDVSIDITTLKGAHDHGKLYMMGLSPLQYKDSYGANVYRPGDINLPIRMEGILSMNPQPDFVQFQTWNDGPESHYIGNLWPEQNTDIQPSLYANDEYWPHQAWQPLVSSFIDAYKNGKGFQAMTPQDGSLAVGAAWYRVVDPETAVCVNEGTDKYFNKPDGFTDGLNALYFSMVVNPSAARGYTVVIDAGGEVKTWQYAVNPGLNIMYSGPAVLPGAQKIQLKDPGGNVVMSTTGGMCVSAGCPTLVYASNYQVLPLVKGDNPKHCTTWPNDVITSATLAPTPTPTPIPAPPPTPTNWASLGNSVPGAQCGFNCNAITPVFNEDDTRSYCQIFVDDACAKDHLLYGVGGVGSGGWARNTNVDCAITGPATVDECFGFFNSAYGLSHAGGPGGSVTASVPVLNKDGTLLGVLGFAGTCAVVGPGGCS